MTFEYTRGRKKRGRWIDTRSGDIINADELQRRYQSYENISSQRMRMLRFMIEGKTTVQGSKYGGNGKCLLNCEGGFAYNAEVKRMLKRGEITIHRSNGYPSGFSSAHIRRTCATVTEKGRAAYERWKKRNA